MGWSFFYWQVLICMREGILFTLNHGLNGYMGKGGNHAFIKINATGENMRKQKRNSWKLRFLEGFHGSGENI